MKLKNDFHDDSSYIPKAKFKLLTFQMILTQYE